MSKGNNVLEARLRPPVELWSAATAFGCASVAAFAPWALMMPQGIGVATAAMAGGFGVYRARQGISILKYHYHLKYTKTTKIAPHKLPVKPGEFYLGEGFEWTHIHAQRKYDAQEHDAKPFVTPSVQDMAFRRLGASLKAWTLPRLEESKALKIKPTVLVSAVDKAVGYDAWWNPLQAQADLGGSPVLHGVGIMDEKPITMKQDSRNGHMLVLGTTRVGKTRMLEMLATQDIHAGHVTIIIDPKGDADLMLRVQAEAKRAGREKNCYLFHLGYPEISARYNGIGNFSRITEVAARTTNALPSSGNSAAFKEFSWRFTNLVAQAQVALGRVPTYDMILRDVTGIDPLFMDYATFVLNKRAIENPSSNWQDELFSVRKDIIAKKTPVPRSLMDRSPELISMVIYVKELRLPDNVLSGLAASVSYERSFYEKIIASLGPFLEKLTSGQVGKLISPDYFDPNDKRPIFDWMTVIRQDGIVYAGLDALSDAVVSGAVGNSMLADLVSTGGKLYKTGLDPHHPEGKVVLPTVCGHFDEVNEICGPEFVPMVNKLGGAGFRITAYTQSMFDIEAKVGDRAKAGQILDNFNHLVMLRVRSLTTANLLAEQTPQVNIAHLTPMSGVSDTAADGHGVDFTSRNDDLVQITKQPLIQASDLLELPKGQAFCLLEGNRRFKIRIPLPDNSNDPFVPESLQKVASDMRARYRTSESWWKETDWLGDHINIDKPMINTGLAFVPDPSAIRAFEIDEETVSHADGVSQPSTFNGMSTAAVVAVTHRL
ncbi:MAG: type IV conjugative transfer system coupling protein TraD [Rhodoferax sp.]|nr:type IV conjugative transfer system coupling protein TraD [Rhodoferax sp.]